MRTLLVLASLLYAAATFLGCAGGYSPDASDRIDGGPQAVAPASVPAVEAAAAERTPGAPEIPAQAGADVADPGKIQRQIIYTAELRLVVEDFADVPDKVAALVRQFGGFVANSQLSGRTGSPRNGVWKIRTPVIGYSDFVQAVRALGEVQTVSTDSKDVTEEYYDIEARIRNKQKEEARLLKHLDENTGKLEEILAVEREISRVREELERMEGRLRVLKDLVALTTITLHIDEIKGYVPPQAPTLATRVERAFTGSVSALRVAAEGTLVALVALSPWLVVFAIPTAILFWSIRKLGKRRSIWVK
jgi:hypothetical protein